MSDPWEDEGFGGEDDWAGDQGPEADLEDDALAGFDELDDADLDEADDDTQDDREEL